MDVELELTESPETEAAWAAWLEREQNIALKGYVLNPKLLIADQRREREISSDYEGREILELLQNAADAAKDSGVLGRVRVELTHEGLIVANTGKVFSPDGVSSLQMANISPKPTQAAGLIGSKGLGFRSILNWSRQPMVFSGALALSFSEEYAAGKIKNLADSSPTIAKALSVEKTPSNLLLRFPLQITEQVKRQLDNDIHSRCESLLESGFDTVIAMPFDQHDGYEHADKQIRQLRPEFLLFAHWLEEISLNLECYGERSWQLKEETSAEKPSHQTSLIDILPNGNKETTQWSLYHQRGNIPTEYLPSIESASEYEIVIALKAGGLVEPSNLYSFFPTSIPMPLPVLCHATLALEQNRKHLQEENRGNHYVLQQLAEYLLAIAEQQAKESDNPYIGIDLVRESDPFQDDLRVFKETLTEKRCLAEIVPCLAGAVAAPNAVKQLSLTDYSFLPESAFGELALARDTKDLRFYTQLEIEPLGSEGFFQCIDNVEVKTPLVRAAIIAGLIKSDLSKRYYYPALLLDSCGEEVAPGETLFPNDLADKSINLPVWADVKLLNSELFDELKALLSQDEVKGVRSVTKWLEPFGLKEYSLSALIVGLVKSGERHVEFHPEEEEKTRVELLDSIYRLYVENNVAVKRHAFPVNAKVQLKSQVGAWVDADTLYFGGKYGTSGEVLQVLFDGNEQYLIASDYLVDWPSDDSSDVISFLSWIGVAQWPRPVLAKECEREFAKYIFTELTYPARFEDYIVEDPSEVNQFSVDKIKSIEHLDCILGSDSDAVLAWLTRDVNLYAYFQGSSDNAFLKIKKSYGWNFRQYRGELPSYLLWNIQHKPWLRGRDAKKYRPIDCLLQSRGLQGVFPVPARLDDDVKELFSLDDDKVRFALLSIGVKGGLDELSSEDVYGILNKLPDLDLAGESATKFCRWLVKTTDFYIDKSGAEYKKFMQQGKVWSKCSGRADYQSISDVYHVDVEGIPDRLLKNLATSILPKKRGPEKVKSLFGINVVDKNSIQERMSHHSAAICSVYANTIFQESKQYISFYRDQKSTSPITGNRFTSLELCVCTELSNEVVYNEVSEVHTYKPGSYTVQDGTLYVVCDELKDDDPRNSLLANTIGDAVASIYELTDGTPFSQLYACDSDDRAKLLVRMLGDDFEGDLPAALKNFERDSQVTDDVIAIPEGALDEVAGDPPGGSNTSKESLPGSAAPTLKIDDTWDVPDNMQVEEKPHVPKAKSEFVGIKVSGGGSATGGGSTISVTRESTGEIGEQLTVLFEEKNGRFPVRVGHITGYDAPGCDILSFSSDKHRQDFLTDKNRSSALVERFIDAKEKRSGGKFQLSLNQVNAADKRKERYYFYRFSKTHNDSSMYELTTLNNPLAAGEGVLFRNFELSLDHAATAQRYDISQASPEKPSVIEVE